MRTYTAPTLTDFGDLAAVTATLGDPFTGDITFDLDGNVLEVGMNSIAQCPAIEGYPCELANEYPYEQP